MTVFSLTNLHGNKKITKPKMQLSVINKKTNIVKTDNKNVKKKMILSEPELPKTNPEVVAEPEPEVVAEPEHEVVAEPEVKSEIIVEPNSEVVIEPKVDNNSIVEPKNNIIITKKKKKSKKKFT